MASEEGNLKLEEDRADRRADEIMKTIKTNQIEGEKELYKLNLGQYQQKTNESHVLTATQRRVIIVGIMAKDKTMTFDETKEGVKKALAKSKNLVVVASNYSKFDFFKVN